MSGGSDGGTAVEGDTVARNTGLALITQLVTATFTAGLILFLVRALGPDSYGELALAMALGFVLMQPADLGITQSAARFAADHRADSGAVASVLSDALRLKLLAGGLVCGGLFALAGPIASAYGEPGLAWPLRGMAIAVFAQSLTSFWATSFVALRRVALNLRVVLSESAVEVSASVALVLLGGGAAGAAFGRAIGYGFGAVVAAVLLVRLLGGASVSIGRRGRGHARNIARYAGAMLIIDSAFTAAGQVSALVIGAFLSAAQVGLYQAPNRLTTMLVYPGLALANGVAPRMSRSGDGPDVGSFRAAIRYLLIIQVAIAVPLVVWADPLTELLLGDEYGASAEVLRALGPYILVSGLAPLLSLAVNYLGEARRRVRIAILALVINLAGAIVLVPEIGIVGAAISTDVAIVYYTLAHFWLCREMVGLSLRPLAATFARAIAAGAAMAALLFAIGTADVGVIALILGGLASLAVFLAVLAALGELEQGELGRVRTTLRRWRRRGPPPNAGERAPVDDPV